MIPKNMKFEGIAETVEKAASISNVRYTRMNTGDYGYVLTTAQLSEK